ncbi:hypothetical protein [Massilia endophytica]|uniref:hypothetical protein n=1 Tax=Massilia endophytica TaxID=2899220 RepID=UPI001E40E810|nr:hypothetical protein [Massilia endophytica]UGQ47084.1 hypothetical protein LSQ66_00985 [Massilia endophytica]
MDMLKNAVGNATANAVANAATGAVTKALSGDKAAEKPADAQPAAEEQSPLAAAAAALMPAQAAAKPALKPGCEKVYGKPLAPLGERPESFPEILWPENSGCDVAKFADYKFEAAKKKKQEFVNASAVSCSDCEGGKAYDAWAQHAIGKSGVSSDKFTEMLVALKPGESIKWKGSKFSGTIVLSGEQAIGSFPCKQFHWTLKDKANKVAAEREGLYCEWQGGYSASAKWQEVL